MVANLGNNQKIFLRERYAFLKNVIKPGERVLEVGTGIGLTANYLPKVKLIQTDVEANHWLDVASDVEALPFPDKLFDAIVCILVLHHVQRPRTALSEFSRILKPDGVLIVIESHNSWLLRRLLSLLKHEYVDENIDPFSSENCQRGADNWDGNNAIGDLLFLNKERFKREFPEFSIVHHRFTESLLFMNSGGVNCKAPYVPLPEFILNKLAWLDRKLCRAAPDIFAMSQEIILRRSCPEQ